MTAAAGSWVVAIDNISTIARLALATRSAGR